MNSAVLFQSKEIGPTVNKKFFDKYYPDTKWVEFDPGTIWADLFRDIKVQVDYRVRDKINALRFCLMFPEKFYVDWIVFEKTILAFNGAPLIPDTVQACTPEEMAFGLLTARKVLPVKEFSEDVLTYIRACCDQAGLLVYHDTFKFAEPKYKKLNEVAAQAYELLTKTPRTDWGKINFPPAVRQVDMLVYIDDYIKVKLDSEQEALKNVRLE
jgi:hypothetical protein